MHWFAWWPTLIVLAVATFTDLRNRRIPNWLVVPFLLAGIVVSPWRHDWNGSRPGFGWHGLGQSFEGLGLALLIYGFLFWKAGMGAGDVKLCAAIGAWIGPSQLFIAVVITAMAGGIMVLGWIAFGFLRDQFAKACDFVLARKERDLPRKPSMAIADLLKRKMPYAPAIAVGTVISFFSLPR
jgi:prepilin peptidase CpaA